MVECGLCLCAMLELGELRDVTLACYYALLLNADKLSAACFILTGSGFASP